MLFTWTIFILYFSLPQQSCAAKSPLKIRLSINNDSSLSSQNFCNFVSITILSTGETIYLREMTGTIFRPTVLLPGQNFPKICLYQETMTNTSRVVSLSVTNGTFNAFISYGGSSFAIDRGNITAALEEIELAPYEELVKGQNTAGVCGVGSKSKSPLIEAQLLDSKVSFYNATITDYYVELYIVADVDMYQRWTTNTEATIYTIINYVNALYRNVGVHVFVVGIEIWKTGNRINVTADSGFTLQNLANYRATLTTNHDNIHLISGISYNSGVLGLAYVGGMCQFLYSAGFSSDRSLTSYALTASTVAHEMGHNFGLNHDTDSCTCPPDSFCIMNAYSHADAVAMKWSTCSLSVLSSNLQVLQSVRCLQNVPNLLTITNANLCGNGVIDDNEECDPGILPASSTCCDATTCKLTSGSECASGRCCDKSTCKPLAAGTQCRSAYNQCDLPEYCDGVTEYCPEDRYKMNAVRCDSDKGYCYNGYCSSQNLQCKQVLNAPGGAAPTGCFTNNADSDNSWTGYCTYRFTGFAGGRPNYAISSCATANAQCGLLQCTNFSTNVFFTSNDLQVNSDTCFQATFNANLTGVRDPTLVQDGSECSTGKWCINSICQTADVLPASCSCSSHGVCNDLSNCHCDNGYSDEACSTSSGCGGSVDSGPACRNVPVPSVCPANYCKNGGTCVLNTDGSQCSFGAPYCCRCGGNYLEPNCVKTSTKFNVMVLTSGTTFLPDYTNSSSAAFKLFEQTVCQMVRVSFRRYLGTSGFSCQIANLTAGSVIATTIIRGDTALPSSVSSIANSVTKFCQQSGSQSTCNNTVLKLGSVVGTTSSSNSCAVANACPTSPITYICTPVDSTTYTCSCPSGYRSVSSTSSNIPQCTEICYSNATQCSNNGVCQENAGKTASCVCNTGYTGQRCNTPTSTTSPNSSSSTTTIIIAVVVGVGGFIIILTIVLVVLWKKGCFSGNSKSEKHAAPQPTAPPAQTAPPGDFSVRVMSNGTRPAATNGNQVSPSPIQLTMQRQM